MIKVKTKRNLTLISAIITLISFLYKLGLAYLTMSLVLLIAAISTLMVFICKMLFVKNVTKKEKGLFFNGLISINIFFYFYNVCSI